MKALTLCAIAILTVSCNQQTFKVGDCVQKPDSMIVYKITNQDDQKMTMEQNQNPQIEKTKQIDLSGEGWIKTQCL